MRRQRPGWLVAALLSVLLCLQPTEATAQFSAPCEVTCAAALFGSSFVIATGAATAAGRLNGGYTTVGEGLSTWGASFVISAAAGIALSGNGGRQERAAYASGLGVAVGALVGLAAESALGDSSKATRLAATLIGAAAGAVVGGVVGATTYDSPGSTPATFDRAFPLWEVRVGF